MHQELRPHPTTCANCEYTKRRSSGRRLGEKMVQEPSIDTWNLTCLSSRYASTLPSFTRARHRTDRRPTTHDAPPFVKSHNRRPGACN